MKDKSLRETWCRDLEWVLTDGDKEDSNCKKATYTSKHIFELVSKNIFQSEERGDFKEISVALTDYLKITNFIEEVSPLQQIALAIAVGYYYRKLESKHIVEIKEKEKSDQSA